MDRNSFVNFRWLRLKHCVFFDNVFETAKLGSKLERHKYLKPIIAKIRSFRYVDSTNCCQYNSIITSEINKY